MSCALSKLDEKIKRVIEKKNGKFRRANFRANSNKVLFCDIGDLTGVYAVFQKRQVFPVHFCVSCQRFRLVLCGYARQINVFLRHRQQRLRK